MSGVGVVVIGRNEGERLGRCLRSVRAAATRVVYVDSGSSDGSIDLARSSGVDVVVLDMTTPFSAARARNAGYARLIEAIPGLACVQFVDGDCELHPGWLAHAVERLSRHDGVAIVAGRLKERFPDASIYNRLGELEWNFHDSGDVQAVGGIFLVRCEAFDAAGAFDTTVTAGEEPELCQRLIRRGWRILRVDHDMAWHDLAMTRFGQWWRRQVRTGYGGMDVARRFALADYRRNNLRARFWTAWPALAGACGWTGFVMVGPMAGGLAAASVLAIWPAQMGRIALRTRRAGHATDLALAHGFFTMLSFWPQMLGQVAYLLDMARKRSPRLIEYKSGGDSNPPAGRIKSCRDQATTTP